MDGWMDIYYYSQYVKDVEREPVSNMFFQKFYMKIYIFIFDEKEEIHLQIIAILQLGLSCVAKLIDVYSI